MPWWDRNNLRLIQTNLRAKDAAMDRRSLIEKLKEFSCNALLLNTGGLMAFYPTALDFHYRSPWLGDGDLTGDMVKLCHDNGIRFIARFDFSKIHESVYAKHPGWAYRSPKGEAVNYHGMVHACVNGEFQRERSLAILDEATDRYPIDGVFFNMFGYTVRDYSNNYYGICQCENCARMFRERYGEELPKVENPEDPVFRLYRRFQEETSAEMLARIRGLVKGKSPELAISTYASRGVDIVKKESNTEVHRPLPVWEYSASENCQSVEGSWDDKIVSNVCINAAGIDYRFQGVHRSHTAIRLYQALASGSGLDFCIIGVFDDYPDGKNFPVVKDVYRFHKEREKHFGNFDIVPDVLLVKPGPHPAETQAKEYQGLFKMLKEAHVQFRVVEQRAIERGHIENSRLVLCADPEPADALLDLLEEAQAEKKPVIWTGCSWGGNVSQKFMRLFSIEEAAVPESGKWGYLCNRPGELFGSLSETGWTLYRGPELSVRGAPGREYGLEKLSRGFFGPPEMCGGHNPSGEYALLMNNEKRTALFSFQPGWLYTRYGYDEYRFMVIDALFNKGWFKPSLRIEAHPMVEAFLNRYRRGAASREAGNSPAGENALYNLQLINLSGYNGVSFHEPLPAHDISVSITLAEGETPRELFSLVSGRKLPFEACGRELRFAVPRLERYEMIVIGG